MVAAVESVTVVVAPGWLSPPQAWGRLGRLLGQSSLRLEVPEGFASLRPSLPRWTRALVASVAAAPGPVVVVGHSLGSVPAMAAARECQVPVATVAPSALPRAAVVLAGSLAGKLTVLAPQLDALCAGDAVRLADAAGVDPWWLPGVSHAGFLDPAADRLAKVGLLRRLEVFEAERRWGARPRSPAWQARAVAAALTVWARASVAAAGVVPVGGVCGAPRRGRDDVRYGFFDVPCP